MNEGCRCAVPHGSGAPAERLVQALRPIGIPPSPTGWPTRIKAQAYRLHTFGTVTRLQLAASWGRVSVTKVFWSDLDVALHQTALDMRGPDGELADQWTDGLAVTSLGGPIYAGTNEIQRNIIAERLPGPPREKAK